MTGSFFDWNTNILAGKPQSQSRYFTNTAGELIATVGNDENQSDQGVEVNYLEHVVGNRLNPLQRGVPAAAITRLNAFSGGRFRLSVAAWNDALTVDTAIINPRTKTELEMPLKDASYPPRAANRPLSGMEDLNDVAQELCADSAAVNRLTVYNGIGSADGLEQGQVVKAPVLPSNGYRGSIARPESEYLATIQGQLMPHLTLPRIRPNWLTSVGEGIADFVGAVMGFWVGGPEGAALGAALADTVYQGAAINLKLETRFNLLQVATAAVTAYALPVGVSLAMSQIVARSIAIALGEQLLAMELDPQSSSFDFESILTQAAMTVAMSRIGPLEEHDLNLNAMSGHLITSVESSFGQGVLDQALNGRPFNAYEVAAESVTGAVEGEVSDEVANHMSAAYRETAESAKVPRTSREAAANSAENTKEPAYSSTTRGLGFFSRPNRSQSSDVSHPTSTSAWADTATRQQQPAPKSKINQANKYAGPSHYPEAPNVDRMFAAWEKSNPTTTMIPEWNASSSGYGISDDRNYAAEVNQRPVPHSGPIGASFIPSVPKMPEATALKVLTSTPDVIPAVMGIGARLSMPDLMDAFLEGTAENAKKVSMSYQEKYLKYISIARVSNNQAAERAWNIFTQPNSPEVSFWKAEQNAFSRESRYNMDAAEKLAPKMQFWSKGIMQNLDKFGTGAAIAGVAGEVITAKTPEEAAKTAFVGTVAISGGRMGTILGTGMAFVEETGAPVVSTPVAIATVAGMNIAGTYIFEKGAALLWDMGEEIKEEYHLWSLNR